MDVSIVGEASKSSGRLCLGACLTTGDPGEESLDDGGEITMSKYGSQDQEAGPLITGI